MTHPTATDPASSGRRRTLTPAERILRSHHATGYELPDGSLRVLSVYTVDGVLGEEWETLPPVAPEDRGSVERDPLMHWLGY